MDWILLAQETDLVAKYGNMSAMTAMLIGVVWFATRGMPGLMKHLRNERQQEREEDRAQRDKEAERHAAEMQAMRDHNAQTTEKFIEEQRQMWKRMDRLLEHALGDDDGEPKDPK